MPGLVHRYPDRVLMLVTTQCACYCRYCTRSRIVGDPTQNFNRRDHEAQLEYLAAHAPGARRAHLRRRPADARAQAPGARPARPARDPAHRDRAHRHRACRCSCRSASTTSCARCWREYHPLWMNLHFNHPNEITPEVSRAVDRLTRAGIPVGNQSVLLAGVNDCVHIQRALVHKLVENRIRPYYLYQCDLVEGSGPLPHARRQGPRDHRGAARPHQRLRRAHLRHRRAGRRRQDPGDAQLPHQLLRPQGRAAQLRGLHHDLRGAARPTSRHDRGRLQLLPAPASGARPERRPWPAPGRPDVDRADAASRRSTPAATSRRIASRTR